MLSFICVTCINIGVGSNFTLGGYFAVDCMAVRPQRGGGCGRGMYPLPHGVRSKILTTS